ncbi:hypothetical protein OG884_18620 [Streptosporangium sp. NBC_01755]|uniref:hypothetical protein n=1 Tax=unclassified Streptosporangium TaxID=2632669 RepID=UPI002DDC5D20|nr:MULTISPECIES: hypothetical protein [unclassified Streptosporangium]WSA23718.1 hypothetical protein OIE13_22515 [Streptosporangium sp. NBC_01810]WSD03822.1 hypothetical protein OG884_18620 [Streptosporangium sp. NBC_01755]
MRAKRPPLLDRARWWWMFRDVWANDITLAASGGRVFLEMHTRSRYKRCIVVKTTPDELRLLADQIRDMLDDPEKIDVQL